MTPNKFFHDASMYWYPLEDRESNLNTLEQACITRMKVLCVIQDIVRELNNDVSPNVGQIIAKKLRTLGFDDYAVSIESPSFSTNSSDIKRRILDYNSHYTLLMFLVSDRRTFRWTYEREIDLFAARISALNSNDMQRWLEINHMKYQQLSDGEKSVFKNLLWTGTPSLHDRCDGPNDLTKFDFFKVPFKDALDLVHTRFTLNGAVFIPDYELKSPAINLFAKALEFRMSEMKRLNTARWDPNFDRLREFFEKSIEVVRLNRIGIEAERILLNRLPDLIDGSFPPCMVRVHGHLKRYGHLGYFGRRQYQLFLKDIGLSVDDCYDHIKNLFVKVKDDKEFDRRYGYYLKHDYGLVGGRIQYESFKCDSIIAHTPMDRSYGCPFVDATASGLASELSKYSHGDIEDLAKLINGNDREGCKNACNLLLKRHCGLETNRVISNPVDFFHIIRFGVPDKSEDVLKTDSDNFDITDVDENTTDSSAGENMGRAHSEG